jgi:hypothetical protein
MNSLKSFATDIGDAAEIEVTDIQVLSVAVSVVDPDVFANE